MLHIKLYLANNQSMEFPMSLNLGFPLVSIMHKYWRDATASAKPSRLHEVMDSHAAGIREPTEHESRASETDLTEE